MPEFGQGDFGDAVAVPPEPSLKCCIVEIGAQHG